MRTLVLLMAACFLRPAAPRRPGHRRPKEMKVGFIYISPIGEGGWSYAHDQARKFLSSLPGRDDLVCWKAYPKGRTPMRIIQNMARKHYDIILRPVSATWIPMLNVAEQFPNSTFMHCSGYKTAPNMSNYFGPDLSGPLPYRPSWPVP